MVARSPWPNTWPQAMENSTKSFSFDMEIGPLFGLLSTGSRLADRFATVGAVADSIQFPTRLLRDRGSGLAWWRLAFPRQALGQEHLEQRLIRNVAAIRQYFEILNHGDRESQRYRLQRRFEVNEFLALSRSPIHVLR